MSDNSRKEKQKHFHYSSHRFSSILKTFTLSLIVYNLYTFIFEFLYIHLNSLVFIDLYLYLYLFIFLDS